jgi:hypothetical protein
MRFWRGRRLETSEGGHAPNLRNAIRCCWSSSQLVDQNITHTAKTESVGKSRCNEEVIDLRFTLSLSVTNILYHPYDFHDLCAG